MTTFSPSAHPSLSPVELVHQRTGPAEGISRRNGNSAKDERDKEELAWALWKEMDGEGKTRGRDGHGKGLEREAVNGSAKGSGLRLPGMDIEGSVSKIERNPEKSSDQNQEDVESSDSSSSGSGSGYATVTPSARKKRSPDDAAAAVHLSSPISNITSVATSSSSASFSSGSMTPGSQYKITHSRPIGSPVIATIPSAFKSTSSSLSPTHLVYSAPSSSKNTHSRSSSQAQRGRDGSGGVQSTPPSPKEHGAGRVESGVGWTPSISLEGDRSRRTSEKSGSSSTIASISEPWPLDFGKHSSAPSHLSSKTVSPFRGTDKGKLEARSRRVSATAFSKHLDEHRRSRSDEYLPALSMAMSSFVPIQSEGSTEWETGVKSGKDRKDDDDEDDSGIGGIGIAQARSAPSSPRRRRSSAGKGFVHVSSSRMSPLTTAGNLGNIEPSGRRGFKALLISPILTNSRLPEDFTPSALTSPLESRNRSWPNLHNLHPASASTSTFPHHLQRGMSDNSISISSGDDERPRSGSSVMSGEEGSESMVSEGEGNGSGFGAALGLSFGGRAGKGMTRLGSDGTESRNGATAMPVGLRNRFQERRDSMSTDGELISLSRTPRPGSNSPHSSSSQTPQTSPTQALLYLRLLAIVPAIVGSVSLLLNASGGGGGNDIFHPLDALVCLPWAYVTASFCFELTTGLAHRWLLYYSYWPACVRLVSLQAICWPSTAFTVRYLGKYDILMAWVVVGTTTACSRSIQIWVTSNVPDIGRRKLPNLRAGNQGLKSGGLNGDANARTTEDDSKRKGIIRNTSWQSSKEEAQIWMRQKVWDWNEVGRLVGVKLILLYFLTSWYLLWMRHE